MDILFCKVCYVPSGLFMFRDDRMRPKSVALKSTIPSFVSGMFMVTRRWENNDTINKFEQKSSKDSPTSCFRNLFVPAFRSRDVQCLFGER